MNKYSWDQIDHVLYQKNIPKMYQIRIKQGLDQLQGEEDIIKPCGCDMDVECEDCNPSLRDSREGDILDEYESVADCKANNFGCDACLECNHHDECMKAGPIHLSREEEKSSPSEEQNRKDMEELISTLDKVEDIRLSREEEKKEVKE